MTRQEWFLVGLTVGLLIVIGFVTVIAQKAAFAYNHDYHRKDYQEASPSATLTPEPSLDTPTVTPIPADPIHVSDGLSDGRSSCPECTMAPTATPTLIPVVSWK